MLWGVCLVYLSSVDVHLELGELGQHLRHLIATLPTAHVDDG